MLVISTSSITPLRLVWLRMLCQCPEANICTMLLTLSTMMTISWITGILCHIKNRCALSSSTHTTSTRYNRSQCTMSTVTSASATWLSMVLRREHTLRISSATVPNVDLSSARLLALKSQMISNSALMKMFNSSFQPRITTRVEMLMSVSSCQEVCLPAKRQRARRDQGVVTDAQHRPQ